MVKKVFILVCFLSVYLKIDAQERIIDSLKAELKNAKVDTKTIIILSKLSNLCQLEEILMYSEPCLKLCEKGLALSNTTNKFFYIKHKADALNNIGFVATQQGNITKGIDYYNQSLKIREEISDKIEIAVSLNNLGYIYSQQGDITKALDYYHKSLKIQEIIDDKKGMALSFSNIGVIYKDQGYFSNALEYYLKGLEIRKKINDLSGISVSLNNIGYIYSKQNKLSKALEYYNKSLKIKKALNDKMGISNTLSNIGNIYNSQNDLKKALEFYDMDLKIKEEIIDKKGITVALNYIADIKLKMGLLTEAREFAKRSMQNSKELGYPQNIMNSASTLKNIYKKQNKFPEALAMYELQIQMKDSLNSEEAKSAALKLQFQFQYEKQVAADSLKNVEEQKLKNAQLTAQQAQLSQEKTQRFALYGGLILLVAFLGFVLNRFKISQIQKEAIRNQKELVDLAYIKLNKKNKEVMDSINYAERIQRSFLASTQLLDENLKNYFVLFQPKDVVSGDFYWASKLSNGNFILVTADSTGHGVPGAIMSLLNISSLEKAVEQGFLEPSEIFNHTRKTIIERLKKDGSVEGGKDGMDCSLINFDFINWRFTYSAANNPVWIVRENQILELAPDKMPVGKSDRDSTSFTQHEVNLQKGDVVYALTDGLPDQFGGPKGKKFMYKKLKELLISISFEPMEIQKQKLTNALNDWKGDLEQVDDVTLIGVRI